MKLVLLRKFSFLEKEYFFSFSIANERFQVQTTALVEPGFTRILSHERVTITEKRNFIVGDKLPIK